MSAHPLRRMPRRRPWKRRGHRRVPRHAPVPPEPEAGAPERALVDRIVDGRHAVLLVGEAESERIEPIERLPAGTGAGDWLQVRYRGDVLVEATPDPEATRQARDRVAAKRALLLQRGSRAQREGP